MEVSSATQTVDAALMEWIGEQELDATADGTNSRKRELPTPLELLVLVD